MKGLLLRQWQIAMAGVFLMFSVTAFSQPDNINIIRDARVDELVDRYKEVHSKSASIQGYRIQVLAGTNRNKIYDAKSQFYTYFSGIKQYVVYQAPNFKLRVGNYRTRLEAYKDLQKILTRFNGAFIIRDEIKLSEL